MIRFPHTLEMLYEEDASLKPDGSWTDATHEWRVVGRCNAIPNGKAQEIRGQNGKSFAYAFEVTMPANTPPVPLGTKVRILDNRGRNIFDGMPTDDSSASYTVLGFYKSGQRYEYTKLWV